jgi:hypothetical protein
MEGIVKRGGDADGNSTRPPDSFSSSGGSSEMARRDIIPLPGSNTTMHQWRISVICKNSGRS